MVELFGADPVSWRLAELLEAPGESQDNPEGWENDAMDHFLVLLLLFPFIEGLLLSRFLKDLDL